ncbi:hypothetical protein D3C87_1633090 [compost metagenome]
MLGLVLYFRRAFTHDRGAPSDFNQVQQIIRFYLKKVQAVLFFHPIQNLNQQILYLVKDRNIQR